MLANYASTAFFFFLRTFIIRFFNQIIVVVRFNQNTISGIFLINNFGKVLFNAHTNLTIRVPILHTQVAVLQYIFFMVL